MQLPSSPAVGIISILVIEYLRRQTNFDARQIFWVEWLSWAILTLLGRFGAYKSGGKHIIPSDTEAQTEATTKRTWLSGETSLALVVVSAQLIFDVELGIISWALPLVTALTYGAAFLACTFVDQADVQESGPLHRWKSSVTWTWGRNNVVTSLVLYVLLSLVSSTLLISITNEITISLNPVLGFSFLLLQTVIHVFSYVREFWLEIDPRVRNASVRGLDLATISTSSVVVWGLVLILWRPTWPSAKPALVMLAMLRSLQLFITFDLISTGATITATTMHPAAFAIFQCLSHSSEGFNVSMAVVAASSIVQASASVPAPGHRRRWLLLLLLLPGFVVLRSVGGVAGAPKHKHPIELLVQEAEAQAAYMIDRQSGTVHEAVAEYVKRYRRQPPPGFDKWFQIAQEEDYVLIDEFDTIMESMEPYWGISPDDLRARVDSALKAEHIINFTIRKHKLGWAKENFAPWIKQQVEFALRDLNWRMLLPDMTFALNDLDEPRVLAPYDEVVAALQSAKQSAPIAKSLVLATETMTELEVIFYNLAKQDAWHNNAWRAMASSCPAGSPSRELGHSREPVSHETDFHFVSNVSLTKDICDHSELLQLHGLLSSPDSLPITHSLVPILSQGKPSIFNDILYPSPFYTGKMDQEEYSDDADPNWDQKSSKLYWTGSATGGFATAQNWQVLHRQRLALKLASDSTAPVTMLNQTSPGQWSPYKATWSTISNFFDVRITGLAQCEPEACEAQRQAFKLKPSKQGEIDPNRDSLNASYSSKYALDMDGNAFSGRFYRLLKSRSAVIKQTIFKEWHDGRLVPWIHFIPLSMEADELGEIMRFLTQEKAGRAIGKKIAAEGRNWSLATLKRRDLEVTFLRILMEYGRLMDDRRDTLYYSA